MRNHETSRVGRLLALGPTLFDGLSRYILNAGAFLEGKIKQPETRAERLKYTRLMGYVAVLRSGGFGALATALPLLFVYFGVLPLIPKMNPDGTSFGGWYMVAFYVLIVFVSLMAAVLELFLLYNDAVRYAGKMNHATSRAIDRENEASKAIESALPAGLTKAALGMVKDRSPKHGINPLEKSSKTGAAAKGLAFKANVWIVNAIVKQMFRRNFTRVLGRTAPRAFIEWLLLPVYVFWNMFGSTKVMNELIARANGPEAAAELVKQVGWRNGLSAPLQGPAKFAITQHVVRSKAFHPNIEFVLLKLGLDKTEEKASMGDARKLDPVEQVQLAKFIVALPYLEVRKIRVEEALWAFVVDVLSEEERRAWQEACKSYIRRGVPF